MSEGFEVYGNGIQTQVENMGDIAPGRARQGKKRVDPKGEALVWSRPLLTRREEHDRAWKIMKIILKLGEGEVPDGSAEGWTVEGERRRVTRKE